MPLANTRSPTRPREVFQQTPDKIEKPTLAAAIPPRRCHPVRSQVPRSRAPEADIQHWYWYFHMKFLRFS
jgi:hypothetical protein